MTGNIRRLGSVDMKEHLRKGSMHVAPDSPTTTRVVRGVTLTTWPCTDPRHYGIGCWKVTMAKGAVVEHHEVRAADVNAALDIVEKSVPPAKGNS